MDDRATLAALLALWASVPDRDLAAAIDLISTRAARSLYLPIANQAAWLAALRRNDLVERHHLLAALSEATPADEVVRIEALGPLVGTDPRVDARIVDHVAHNPARFAPARPIVDLLLATRDPRVVDLGIPRIEATYKNQKGERRRAVNALLRRVRSTQAAETTRPLTVDERAMITAVIAEASRGASRDTQTEESLLAAVYATPFDDAPRSIYADWLMERGDPRGELIALQLLAAARPLAAVEAARAKHLLDAYATVWLGPLAPMASAITFERGFITRCSRRVRHDDPRWSTLEECEHFPPHAAFRSLVRLNDGDETDILRLPTLPDDAPLAELTWQWSNSYNYDAIAAYEAARLPALRKLLLVPSNEWLPEEIAWTYTNRRLERLALRGSPALLARWIEIVEPTTIRSFSLIDAPHELAIERDFANRLSRLSFSTWCDYDDVGTAFERIVPGIRDAAPHPITAFKFENRSGDGMPKYIETQLTEALDGVKIEMYRR